MGFVAAAIVAQSLMQAAFPIVVSEGVDRITTDRTTGLVVALVSAVLVTGVLGWVFNFIQRWYTAKVVGDVVLDLREDAFDAVLDRDMSFYDEHSSGKVVSRVTSDTEDFATVVTLTLNLISQVLLVGLITALLFTRNVTLALLVMAVVPHHRRHGPGFRRIARETTRHQQRSLAKVNATLQETMGGISVAKNFRQEQTIYDEFRPINGQNYRVTRRAGVRVRGHLPGAVRGGFPGSVTVMLVGVGRAGARRRHLGRRLVPALF